MGVALAFWECARVGNGREGIAALHVRGPAEEGTRGTGQANPN